MIQKSQQKHDQKMLTLIPLLLLSVHTIKGIAEFFQNYIIKYVGQKILTNMQMQMYEQMMSTLTAGLTDSLWLVFT